MDHFSRDKRDPYIRNWVYYNKLHFEPTLEGLARRREEKTLYGETAEETGSAEKARAAAAATKATKASEQEFVIELEEGELVGE